VYTAFTTKSETAVANGHVIWFMASPIVIQWIISIIVDSVIIIISCDAIDPVEIAITINIA
jgi:hypothetical protein